ncbi:hypothetical protein [Nostoc sp. ChiVER01]|uniref:hypothetical protein n=1 Tax=Nostoc sp. ChiVER01 TaxID=3075382 RepID=UPI002AD33C76|nr:hypothetical protein [Nostoc sp. ChiVER01]MDZ8224523.1 hypothetical protein [Nostoc sp. ChiVER01]
MKINHKNDENLLFKWFCRGLKYFLLTLLGLAIALVLSHVFGAVSIVGMLLSTNLWICFLRIAVFLFCLFAIAMIVESWS